MQMPQKKIRERSRVETDGDVFDTVVVSREYLMKHHRMGSLTFFAIILIITLLACLHVFLWQQSVLLNQQEQFHNQLNGFTQQLGYVYNNFSRKITAWEKERDMLRNTLSRQDDVIEYLKNKNEELLQKWQSAESKIKQMEVDNVKLAYIIDALEEKYLTKKERQIKREFSGTAYEDASLDYKAFDTQRATPYIVPQEKKKKRFFFF